MRTLLFLFLTFAAVGWAATVEDIVENEQVRIIRVTVPTDHSTGMHVHTINRVMLYLQAGGQSIIRASGPTTVQKWAAGEPLWSPKIGMHRVVLKAEVPNTIIEIELKQDGPANPAPLTPLHPLNADPEHTKLEFENDQVRVFRVTYPAGATIPLHEHLSARATTYITPTDVNTWDESGTMSHAAHVAGDVSWSTSSVRHRAKSLSAGPFEVVTVELK
jgi:quercetin dioxygenase-like cupin family protein